MINGYNDGKMPSINQHEPCKGVILECAYYGKGLFLLALLPGHCLPLTELGLSPFPVRKRGQSKIVNVK